MESSLHASTLRPADSARFASLTAMVYHGTPLSQDEFKETQQLLRELAIIAPLKSARGRVIPFPLKKPQIESGTNVNAALEQLARALNEQDRTHR